jgi:hypothetical protein
VTEAEWLAAFEPQGMLRHIHDSGAFSPEMIRRKFRLFGCACCREVWDRIPERPFRTAIEVAERHADGQVKIGELRSARHRCEDYRGSDKAATRAAFAVTDHKAITAAVFAAQHAAGAGVSEHWLLQPRGHQQSTILERWGKQVLIVRDIFGNPLRPVAFDPSWRTSTAVGLARSIYESRAFDRMPILADALEEAGCDEPSVLEHCRGDGPHVRGCWVVDLILGKA